ncbi:MAG: branched-chain amino acid ABC transporter permease [Acidimicrobiia bacterium]
MEKFIGLAADGIAYGAILALVALGFLVLYKATGIINFAHGELITLGAYLAVWATGDLGLTPVPGYLVALALMAVIGVVLERIVRAPLRGKPMLVVVIATLAAAIVIRGLIALWQGSYPQALVSPVGLRVVHIGGAAVAQQRILIVVVAAVSIAGLMVLFGRTSFGRQVRALAADPDTAALQGVRRTYVAMAAFALSAVLAGLAGILVAPLSAVDLNFGFGLMVTAFAVAVIGGFGSFGGVVVGALMIGIVEKLVGGYFFPDYADLLPYVLMFVVIAVRPEGLVAVERSRL